MDTSEVEAWRWSAKKRIVEMIQLEDFHEDILGKAMRGLGVGKNAMAARTNLEKSQIESVLSGQVDEEVIRLMALQLELDPRKLICSAHKEWRPSSLSICGLKPK